MRSVPDFQFFFNFWHCKTSENNQTWWLGNKLAKLRRHASRVHFASNNFGPIHLVLEHFRLYTLGFEHVSHLVHLHVGQHARLHVCKFFSLIFFGLIICLPLPGQFQSIRYPRINKQYHISWKCKDLVTQFCCQPPCLPCQQTHTFTNASQHHYPDLCGHHTHPVLCLRWYPIKRTNMYLK